MKLGSLDIESNGLLMDMGDFSSFPYKLKEDAKLWVVSFTDIETKVTKSLVKEQITFENLKSLTDGYDYIITHNGVKFDLLVLKLFGVIDYSIGFLREHDTLFGRKVVFIDTLILSRLFEPSRFGGHSLKTWGQRLGNYKDDFRAKCIEANVISKDAPRGDEFKVYSDLMVPYCEQDTIVTADIFKHLYPEYIKKEYWAKAIKMEHKLADLAIKRECLGFAFDKELAIKLVEELNEKMYELTAKVNPFLPNKKLSSAEQKKWTFPAKQIKADGELTKTMESFVERVGAKVFLNEDDDYIFEYNNKTVTLPFEGCLRTHEPATIDDLDIVKHYLISLGWVPTDWGFRDLTKDAKKNYIPLESRIKALDRWFKETLEGKYTEFRLNALEGKTNKEKYNKLLERLSQDFPVKILTSPKVRVGVAKELCPNLEVLGEKVDIAKDFSLYLTYKHRRSAIAGGDIEDMDFDEDAPNTGYLANYREVDGRIPTPAIEIGANTFRYKHVSVANVPRASSIFGKEMRSLFGCGKDAFQFGYDFASLEARIQGHYCYNFTDGIELAKSLLAEKPFDVHSVNAKKMGVTRDQAKSLTYMLMYGGSWVKAKEMLGLTDQEAKDLVAKFWESVPSLKEFKEQLELEWESNNFEFVRAIDGRKLNVRSKHSLVNLVFQSGGVICAKYVTILTMEKLYKMGYCIDPFIGKPDACSMIEYHDEAQMYSNPSFFKFITFNTEEEAKDFVKQWEGSQLSDISHGKKYYVTLPNIISETIALSIKETEEIVNLNVSLGFAYSVANTWYGCH